MDGAQKILIVVIVALSMLLLIAGIQVILIIADIRRALKKLNSILEDALWGGGLIRPEKISGILEMFRRRKKSEVREQGSIHEPPESTS